ncbi:unnamed protein product [Pedinophyceae sp. YPF-701]|nr:unnamed protein product [Pedinophyceae sp. YPF-701]
MKVPTAMRARYRSPVRGGLGAFAAALILVALLLTGIAAAAETAAEIASSRHAGAPGGANTDANDTESPAVNGPVKETHSLEDTPAGPLKRRRALATEAPLGTCRVHWTLSTFLGDGDTSRNSNQGDSIDGSGAGAVIGNQIRSMTFGPDGALYWSEVNAHVVRKATVSGTVTTVAGVKYSGGIAAGAATTTARLYVPHGLAFSRDGRLYISNRASNAVMFLASDGSTVQLAVGATNGGTPSTQSGAGLNPPLSTDGTGRLDGPVGICFDRDDRLMIADTYNRRILRYDPSANTLEVHGGRSGIAGAGDGALGTATVSTVTGVACDHATGNTYFIDTVYGSTPGYGFPASYSVNLAGNRLRVLDQLGTMTSIAGLRTHRLHQHGSDGFGVLAEIPYAEDIAMLNGYVYVSAEKHYTLHMIQTTGHGGRGGTTVTIAGWPRYTALTTGNASDPATRLRNNGGVAVDPATGDVYVGSSPGALIQKLSPAAGAEACVDDIFPSRAPGCDKSRSHVVSQGVAYSWPGGHKRCRTGHPTCQLLWTTYYRAGTPPFVDPVTMQPLSSYGLHDPLALLLPWMHQPHESPYLAEEHFFDQRKPGPAASGTWEYYGRQCYNHATTSGRWVTVLNSNADFRYLSVPDGHAQTKLSRATFELRAGEVPATLRMFFVCQDQCTIYVNGERAAAKWFTDTSTWSDAHYNAAKLDNVWIDLGTDHAGEEESMIGYHWSWTGGGYYRKNVPLREGRNTIDVVLYQHDEGRSFAYAFWPLDAANSFLNNARNCIGPAETGPEGADILDAEKPVIASSDGAFFIGEPTDGTQAPNAGRVAVAAYNTTSDAWETVATITSDDTAAGSRLGADVAASAGWVVAGAPGHAGGAGAVFVFRSTGGVAGPYIQVEILHPYASSSDTSLGAVVAMSEDAENLIVSAPESAALYFYARQASEQSFRITTLDRPYIGGSTMPGNLAPAPGSIAIDAKWGLAAVAHRDLAGGTPDHVLIYHVRDQPHPAMWEVTTVIDTSSTAQLDGQPVRGCTHAIQLQYKTLVMGCRGETSGVSGNQYVAGTVKTYRIFSDGLRQGQGTDPPFNVAGPVFYSFADKDGTSGTTLQHIASRVSVQGDLYGSAVALADNGATLYVLSPWDGLEMFELVHLQSSDLYGPSAWILKHTVPAKELGVLDVDYSPRSLVVGRDGLIGVATAEGVRSFQFVCSKAGRACTPAERKSCPAGTARCVMTDAGHHCVPEDGAASCADAHVAETVARGLGAQYLTMHQGTMYASSDHDDRVYRVKDLRTGEVETFVTGLADPVAVVVRGDTAYVAVSRDHTIRSVDLTQKGPLTQSQLPVVVGASANSGTALGSAAASRLYWPTGLAFQSSDELLIADKDNHRILRLTMSTSTVELVAGIAGFRGFHDGPALESTFSAPIALAWDAANGAILVADYENERIRRIAGGFVTTFAGTRRVGLSALDGFRTCARFAVRPTDVKVDSVGNVYVADSAHGLRMVNATTGNLVTLAGAGKATPGAGAYVDGPASAALFYAYWMGLYVNETASGVDAVYMGVSAGVAYKGFIRRVAPYKGPDAPRAARVGQHSACGTPRTGLLSCAHSRQSCSDVGGCPDSQLCRDHELGHLCGPPPTDLQCAANYTVTHVAGHTGGLRPSSHFNVAADEGPGRAANLQSVYSIHALRAGGTVFVGSCDRDWVKRLSGPGLATVDVMVAETDRLYMHCPWGIAVAGNDLYVSNKYSSGGPSYVLTRYSFADITDPASSVTKAHIGSASGTAGVSGVHTSVKLEAAMGMDVDAAGRVLFVENKGNRVRVYDPATGIISKLAGTGYAGHRDGPGNRASFAHLIDIANDHVTGMTYVTERMPVATGSHWGGGVRQVAPDGFVTTIAAASSTETARGGFGMCAVVMRELGMVAAHNGEVFFTTTYEDDRQVIYRRAGGSIDVIVGNEGTAFPLSEVGGGPMFGPGDITRPWNILGLAYEPSSGKVVYTSVGAVYAVERTGHSCPVHARPPSPGSLCGTKYDRVGCAAASCPSGTTCVEADVGHHCRPANTSAAACDEVWSVNTQAGTGQEGAGDGYGVAAPLASPRGVAVRSNGDVFFPVGNRVFKMDATNGYVSAYAGTGATGSSSGVQVSAATFYELGAMAVGPDDTLWVLEPTVCRLKYITSTGWVWTLFSAGCGRGSSDPEPGHLAYPTDIATGGASSQRSPDPSLTRPLSPGLSFAEGARGGTRR